MSTPTESTATLLNLIRAGDELAKDRLIARYLPMLRHWARGRLPNAARDLNDTQDLVQITLLSALQQLPKFESQHEGAFLAYLRTSLMNNIRMELRRVSRRGGAHEDVDDLALFANTELSQSLGVDKLLDYEKALASLAPARREAVILRFEFGMSFAEIAAAMERPTAAAAHMLVSRALLDLAEALG